VPSGDPARPQQPKLIGADDAINVLSCGVTIGSQQAIFTGREKWNRDK
jgi:hypothetical protein